jgi:hypothetical protein
VSLTQVKQASSAARPPSDAAVSIRPYRCPWHSCEAVALESQRVAERGAQCVQRRQAQAKL